MATIEEIRQLFDERLISEREVALLKNKVSFLESEHKRKNLVLYGVLEQSDESFEQLQESILHILNNLLGLNISFQEIDHCYRLGKRRGSTPRPVLLKCLTQWRKEQIIKNASRLKNHKIYIDHDLNKEQIIRRKELIPVMIQLRNQGKHAVVRLDQLFVDGVKMNAEESQELMTTTSKQKKEKVQCEEEIECLKNDRDAKNSKGKKKWKKEMKKNKRNGPRKRRST